MFITILSLIYKYDITTNSSKIRNHKYLNIRQYRKKCLKNNYI